MKYKLLFPILILFIILITSNPKAEEESFKLGVDLGYGFLDIGADETAQTLANLSGSTVTYTTDYGSWLARVYGDVKIMESLSIDIGLFITGDVEAKYTLSGASATESYSANGVDASLVLKEGSQDGWFIKAGVHSSTVDGNASITIGGTTYAANAASSGTGYLVGGGYDFEDNSRIGYTYYADLGGLSKADLAYIYYGFRF